MLELALNIAKKAHADQIDKAGQEYILHPIHVASLVDTTEAKAVALLHDVIEDSNYTAGALLREGLPYEVVEAVEVLTKKSSESYDEYLNKLKDNELARVVKIADLTHNSDLTRLPNITFKDLERQQKYRQAILRLSKSL
ncbi:GTP pyrophosphokinase [Aerococcaceae bacterium NML160702]|nr:GTP pyrophosphokinase [Aerococcaceae bacterium NML160702]